jgi:hypothetical protein
MMARRLHQLPYWQQYSSFQVLNRIKGGWLLSHTGASQTQAVHGFQKALDRNRHQQMALYLTSPASDESG